MGQEKDGTEGGRYWAKIQKCMENNTHPFIRTLALTSQFIGL